jgi:hypothetical protein
MSGPDILESHGKCRTVVLVAHGLNLRAHALRALYEPLREQGATIVVLRLRGHARHAPGDAAMLEEMRSVDASQWVEDWREGIHVAETLAADLKVPLVFLGYSLGALVHIYGLGTGQLERNPFVRQVLLAPAVRLRRTSRLVLMFQPLGRRFVLPSFARREIRSYRATSVGAYMALLGLESDVSVLVEPDRVKIPTLVLMDPGDELVSYGRLREWIEANGLSPEWRLEAIDKDRATARSRIRHDIVDEHSLGKASYDALTRRIVRALIDGAMDATDEPR